MEFIHSFNKKEGSHLNPSLCSAVLSQVQLGDPWTEPTRLLSIGFPRQEYRAGLSFPLPADLPPLQGLNSHLLHWQVFFTTEPPVSQTQPSLYPNLRLPASRLEKIHFHISLPSLGICYLGKPVQHTRWAQCNHVSL